MIQIRYLLVDIYYLNIGLIEKCFNSKVLHNGSFVSDLLNYKLIDINNKMIIYVSLNVF